MLTSSFSDYVHEFATWTACRAIQRGFVKTALLKEIIEKAGLRSSVDELDTTQIDADNFDEWQLNVAEQLMKKGNGLIGKEGPVMTYGRAAKMIALYIKTSRIINDPESKIAQYAHPPVDRKLLTELRKNFKEQFNDADIKAWTQFNKEKYFETIGKLRQIQKQESLAYFWMIEKYWVA